MNERQRRDAIKKALRNTRRQYRTLDTHLEKMERTLDRLIERKTIITHEQLLPVASLYDGIAPRVKSLEGALSDAIGLASY